MDGVSPYLINMIGAAAGLCSMASFVPQILKLMREKDASAISLRMYAVTVTGFVLWSIYGFLLQAWPVAATNVTCLCLSAAILALKLRYDRRAVPE